jgi:aldehyde:ferredoxin oxidoreductase
MTDHLELGFGKTQTVFELIRRTAMREGRFGKLIGEGTRALAKAIECEDMAMDVKGLGLPAYDPRGIKGLGLNYATAASGASHMRGPTMGAEIGENTRLSEKNKATVVIAAQVSMALADSTCLCSTARGGIDIPQLAEFLEAVTGETFTANGLERIAKILLTLERKFNLREGFSEKDDTLPKRMLTEAFSKGASKGEIVNIETMKKEYYRKMGWDDLNDE